MVELSAWYPGNPGVHVDADIPELAEDSQINICPTVDQVFTPGDGSMLDDCFLCHETIWRMRRVPDHIINLCLPCVEKRAPDVAMAAKQAWGWEP